MMTAMDDLEFDRVTEGLAFPEGPVVLADGDDRGV